MSEEQEYSFLLQNSAEVIIYHRTAEESLKMLKIAQSDDFLNETELIKAVGLFPPISLLIYDEFMAFGLHMETGEIVVAMRPYSENMLLQYVDTAISLRKHPIRVIEKTSNPGEMLRRLKPRTDLDWIEYVPKSSVIREIPGRRCAALRYIESMPAAKDLCTLYYDGKNTEAAFFHINDCSEAREPSDIAIKCEFSGKELYDRTIDSVEQELRRLHPETLIVREPLGFCSVGNAAKPWACIAQEFERIYAEKTAGFKG